MGKNVNSKVVSVRLSVEDAEFLKALAKQHDLSLNAMLGSFLAHRIEEIRGK